MMGGDFAPLEAVKGVQLYLSGHNIPMELFLIGNKTSIEKIIDEHKVPVEHLQIIHAEEMIDSQAEQLRQNTAETLFPF